MSTHLKQRLAEPSIVVDEEQAGPAWTSEETVLFHRDMLPLVQQPPKKRQSLRPALLFSALLVLAAVVLRLLLR